MVKFNVERDPEYEVIVSDNSSVLISYKQYEFDEEAIYTEYILEFILDDEIVDRQKFQMPFKYVTGAFDVLGKLIDFIFYPAKDWLELDIDL